MNLIFIDWIKKEGFNLFNRLNLTWITKYLLFCHLKTEMEIVQSSHSNEEFFSNNLQSKRVNVSDLATHLSFSYLKRKIRKKATS